MIAVTVLVKKRKGFGSAYEMNQRWTVTSKLRLSRESNKKGIAALISILCSVQFTLIWSKGNKYTSKQRKQGRKDSFIVRSSFLLIYSFAAEKKRHRPIGKKKENIDL